MSEGRRISVAHAQGTVTERAGVDSPSTSLAGAAQAEGPLSSVDVWDDHVRSRYQEGRKQEEFRVFDESSPTVVKDFYRLNHTQQTYAFATGKRRQYEVLEQGRMGVWAALEKLNTLVDDSDPDTDLSQIEHCLQTAEAMRANGEPDWMQLTGLMHDLGKFLVFYGEPQWAVVGDTFPVGCAFSDKVVFADYFEGNPDRHHPVYSTQYGVYEPAIGLKNVHMSYGHDEYLYHVVKDYLPEPALYMIRYHSCYPIHREGAYQYLLNDHDREMLDWVRRFNPYDLYSKGHTKPDAVALRPYYEELIAKYFPAELRW